MPVAVEDPYDTYRTKFPCEEHVEISTPQADEQVTCLEEKISLLCTKQSQTIESLLPDEEDLFSGILDKLGCTASANSEDEDFDLFSSNGGIELEGNSKLYFNQGQSLVAEGLNSDQSSSDYLVSCEHPSRTLLVQNVDKRVEDPKFRVLFEQHGDIQAFYITCRSQGFVIISYYDIRAATNAFNTLQNKPLGNENLHIRYLNPKICGTTHHKHIRYYDIRAAEAATNGLSSSNMLQESKLEVNYPKRAKSLMQQLTHGIMQAQLRSCQNPNGNSLPQAVTSCMKDEYIYGVHSLLQPSCSFTSSFPSTVGMPAAYNQFSHMPYYSTDQALHPQSLPISCEGVTTYDSLNLEIVDFTTETYDKHLYMLGSYGPPTGHMFWGSTRMTRSALGGPTRAMSCSNSIQNHHLNPNKCNMGYAFINMTDPLQIVPFYKSINGKKWEKFHSGKVACLAYARIQGKAALIANFQESSLMNEDKCCHPILFATDGPNAGSQEPFPLSPNINSRKHKNRCNPHKGNEDQVNSSTSL
ncbi:hypothetical protein M8C21_012079 [Ambrosia artemisiifolia]|uniref:RRM domain-containing protein n=1 Tax=Ambrosia artemisiifolia TaxID=4212 RepID=A0AAD5C9F0_AMBAR|nr:hypothetical protein M8C21_012079 [Ambrosia artemisiifolia]